MLASFSWAVRNSVKVICSAHLFKDNWFSTSLSPVTAANHVDSMSACALTPFKIAPKTFGDVFCVYSSCCNRLKGDLARASASVLDFPGL